MNLHPTFRTGIVFLSWLKWIQGVVCYDCTILFPIIVLQIHLPQFTVYNCHGLKIRVFYFFYISKTLEMIRISFMASLLNAVL